MAKTPKGRLCPNRYSSGWGADKDSENNTTQHVFQRINLGSPNAWYYAIKSQEMPRQIPMGPFGEPDIEILSAKFQSSTQWLCSRSVRWIGSYGELWSLQVRVLSHYPSIFYQWSPLGIPREEKVWGSWKKPVMTQTWNSGILMYIFFCLSLKRKMNFVIVKGVSWQ